ASLREIISLTAASKDRSSRSISSLICSAAYSFISPLFDEPRRNATAANPSSRYFRILTVIVFPLRCPFGSFGLATCFPPSVVADEGENNQSFRGGTRLRTHHLLGSRSSLAPLTAVRHPPTSEIHTSSRCA